MNACRGEYRLVTCRDGEQWSEFSYPLDCRDLAVAHMRARAQKPGRWTRKLWLGNWLLMQSTQERGP